MNGAPDTRARAEEAFQKWLDLFRCGAAPAEEDFLAQEPEHVRAELQEMLRDYHELRRHLRGPAPALHSGSVIADFRLVREIGRGGMAAVWEAEQLSLGRRVAFKVLHPHYALALRAVDRFEREARAAGKLAHPAIAQIHAVGSAEGVHFIAQELVGSGRTLADALADIRDGRELPDSYFRQMATLFVKVAEALDHAHQHGVVHRDVKPSNVLLDRDDHPKIADFGLALIQDDLALSRTGELLGTPSYMSPEQALGRPRIMDRRSDVFSLGSSLYEALTLTRAFDGDTSQQVVLKLLQHDPPDPRSIRSRVPGDLAVICAKAMEKEPARRYADMRGFVDDLRAFLDGRSISARPATRFERMVRWSRREPLRATLALVLVLTIPSIGGLLGFLIAKRPEMLRAAQNERRSWIEGLLQDGYYELASGDEARALAAFDRVAETDPSNLEAAVGHALATIEGDGPSAAIEWIDHSPLAHEPAMERARVYAEFAQNTRVSQAAHNEQQLPPPTTDFEHFLAGMIELKRDASMEGALRAIPWLKRAVAFAERARPLYLFGFARCAAIARDHDLAELCVATLQEHWPDDPRSLDYQGLALIVLDRRQSVASFRRAIEIDPHDAFAYLHMASTFVSLEEHEAAMEACRRAISIDPELGAAHERLGEMLHLAGRYPEAAAELERAVALEPVNLSYLCSLGRAQYFAGHVDLARASFQRCIDIDPQYAWAQFCLGMCDDATGARALAVEKFAKVRSVHPLPHAYEVVVELLREQGDHEGVLAELDRWTIARPKDPEAWSALADFHLDDDVPPTYRDTGRAVAAAQHAVELTRDSDPRYLHIAARALRATGDFANALARELQAAQIDERYRKPDPELTREIEAGIVACRAALQAPSIGLTR